MGSSTHSKHDLDIVKFNYNLIQKAPSTCTHKYLTANPFFFSFSLGFYHHLYKFFSLVFLSISLLIQLSYPGSEDINQTSCAFTFCSLFFVPADICNPCCILEDWHKWRNAREYTKHMKTEAFSCMQINTNGHVILIFFLFFFSLFFFQLKMKVFFW